MMNLTYIQYQVHRTVHDSHLLEQNDALHLGDIKYLTLFLPGSASEPGNK